MHGHSHVAQQATAMWHSRRAVSKHCYVLRYGLRYLYIKDGKAYAEQEHYMNMGRLSVQCRKQAVHSTAHQSWQALEAKSKWAEW